MNPPDNNVLKAFASLRGEHSFERILDWLRESLSAEDEANRRREGAEIHRGQGRALQLERILEVADTARDLLGQQSRIPQSHHLP